MIRRPAIAVLITLLAAQGAYAKPHLREVTEINSGLLAVGIADEIRKECPSISGRLIKGAMYLKSLENRAKSMGYSEAEVKAYTRDKTEKARMLARGNAYLQTNGVQVGNPQSYCALGRAEIEKASLIGSFLRAK